MAHTLKSLAELAYKMASDRVAESESEIFAFWLIEKGNSDIACLITPFDGDASKDFVAAKSPEAASPECLALRPKAGRTSVAKRKTKRVLRLEAVAKALVANAEGAPGFLPLTAIVKLAEEALRP